MRFPWDHGRVSRMSLIGEGEVRTVRMANLATLGSFAVNGVAAMHSELVKSTILADFHDMWPEKFHNVTNGVTPRRFVLLSNPGLAAILTEIAGEGWPRDMERLRLLESHAHDPGFQERWREMKLTAKRWLAERIRLRTGILVDPASLFDIQAKRIHEYKRQHLNVLHIVNLYNRIKRGNHVDLVPRTFVFAGKAAPGYFMAKLIIKLINAVAEVINHDPQVNEYLRVVFFPDFNVKNAERVYPAADLSEQISLAGKEASGTGNMKFSMNGALTIGTLDGANVEIRDEVGHENFFQFGLTEEQVKQTWAAGYQPWEICRQNEGLREAIELINSGLFSHGDTGLFRPLTDNLTRHDPFMVLADYQAYADCQADVDRDWRDRGHWDQMSILNVARMARFSSDRAIREYCDEIWRVQPLSVKGIGDEAIVE
jgi:starch phosphorylase